MATVPDKRNPSKQRRQARNRASRDALAARRDNAVDVPSTRPASKSSSTDSTSSSGGSSSRTTTKGAATRPAGGRGAGRPVPVAAGPPPRSIGEYVRSKRPGDKAILLAFLFSFVSAIALLLVLKVPVDDRGDGIPPQYGAVTILTRATLTDVDPGAITEDVSTLSAYGPQAILMAATPVLIAGYAVWANRRNDRSRLLTFALIAMAMASLLTGGLTIFLPTLLALGLGTFRVRKADMVAGMAAAGDQPAATGRGRVIEADTVAEPTRTRRRRRPGQAQVAARPPARSRGSRGCPRPLDGSARRRRRRRRRRRH